MPWNISGEELLFAWLEAEPDPATRSALLAWLPVLAEDPETAGDIPLPGTRLPTYVAFVPTPTGPVAVTYVVLGPPLRAVKVVEVARFSD